jgi:thymidine kinase
MSGYLELFIGPMFSGKTSKLLEIYKQNIFCEIPIIVINHSLDTRYHQTYLSTHDKIMIPCVFARTIASVSETIRTADVVLINEGQFFEDICEKVLEMVENQRKIVYICGLDGDFKRNKFGRLLDLIPYCDEIIKLSSLCAWCQNGTHGIFSHRITNETDQVVIGADNYIPLCRGCYKTTL